MRHCCSSKTAKGVSTISALRQASDSANRKRRRGPLQVGHAKRACHSESTIRCFACTQQKRHILLPCLKSRTPGRDCHRGRCALTRAKSPIPLNTLNMHRNVSMPIVGVGKKSFGYWFEGGVALIVRIGLKMSKFENDFVKNEILLRGAWGTLHQFQLPPAPIRDPSSRRVLTPNFYIGQRRR